MSKKRRSTKAGSSKIPEGQLTLPFPTRSIADVRRRHRLSQKKLAALLGMPVEFVQRMEDDAHFGAGFVSTLDDLIKRIRL